jgi:addiction module RelE/StbE family toxin
MRIKTHKQYDKAWAKLNKNQQQRALAALKLFLIDPTSPSLRPHQLKGSYYPQYSISAGGDLRIHYLQLDANTIVLMLIGTHSQLYG